MRKVASCAIAPCRTPVTLSYGFSWFFYVFVSFSFFSTPSCTYEHVQNCVDECGVVALVCLWSKACTSYQYFVGFKTPHLGKGPFEIPCVQPRSRISSPARGVVILEPRMFLLDNVVRIGDNYRVSLLTSAEIALWD